MVSAANAGGYDVESYLVPGQEPFGSYPLASSPSRVLYGVHDGAIPGTNHPTNNGLDPYVATRGEDGWSTAYVGIPANLPYSKSFASTLDGADSRPRKLRLRRPRNLLALLRRRQHGNPGPSRRRQPRPGNESERRNRSGNSSRLNREAPRHA